MEALIRDNYICQECGVEGGPVGDAALQAHHRVPVCEGGSDELSNLETLCVHCHRCRHQNESPPIAPEPPYKTWLNKEPAEGSAYPCGWNYEFLLLDESGETVVKYFNTGSPSCEHRRYHFKNGESTVEFDTVLTQWDAFWRDVDAVTDGDCKP